jgi:DNA-directed RNA polymerase III subunit RPC2
LGGCRGHALVMLNGTILGVHARPNRLMSTLRKLRRAGFVGEFTSVCRGINAVSIACDGGRVCRPLIICDAGIPRLTPEHVAKVGLLAKAGPCKVNSCAWIGV